MDCHMLLYNKTNENLDKKRLLLWARWQLLFMRLFLVQLSLSVVIADFHIKKNFWRGISRNCEKSLRTDFRRSHDIVSISLVWQLMYSLQHLMLASARAIDRTLNECVRMPMSTDGPNHIRKGARLTDMLLSHDIGDMSEWS